MVRRQGLFGALCLVVCLGWTSVPEAAERVGNGQEPCYVGVVVSRGETDLLAHRAGTLASALPAVGTRVVQGQVRRSYVLTPWPERYMDVLTSVADMGPVLLPYLIS